jgi:hypothetical protein
MTLDRIILDPSDRCIVRLYGTRAEDFRILWQSVQTLSGGSVATLEIDELAFVRTNDVRLRFVRASSNSVQLEDGCRVVFRLTPDCWTVMADLIEPLTSPNAQGSYQWLGGSAARYPLDQLDCGLLLSFTERGSW